MPHRVSAIVPTFEMARFVARAAASALAQTGVAVEVVVCDDGSTDDPSAALAGLLRSHGGRLRVVRQENRGLPAARNAAVAASSGEFVAFLDADDVWFPHKSLLQTAALDADPSAAFAWSQAEAVGEDDARWQSVIGHAPPEGTSPRDLVVPIIRSGSMIPVLTGMVRRSAFDAVGGFDESLRRGGEDYDLWLRLAMHGPGVFVPGLVGRYREHAEGFYRSNQDAWAEGVRRVHAKLLAVRRTPEIEDAVALAEHRSDWTRACDHLWRGRAARARECFDAAARHPQFRDAARRARWKTYVPGPLFLAARRMRDWARTG